ncbi:unnamed protein product [Adineta ricciae]|uniref:NAD(P)(+)--arginine ADP-ribosyltransferase n=1 Tax=Adineta ricciae TaxID=249248 RepID=A0A815VPZ2_ADIRI|nr:unnamed protein product [Adineta ricciae]CAF1593151.1 unnamed protein product [Adineta ricciae]
MRTFWYYETDSTEMANNWLPFSDIGCEILEEAFKTKDEEIELDDYVVNLKENILIKKENKSKQYRIKRVENVSRTEMIRHGRFCDYEPLTNRSFKESDNKGDYRGFIWSWYEKQNESGVVSLPTIIEKAAVGIQIEGKLCRKSHEANWLTNRLLQVKHQKEDIVGKCCIMLYTRECFLYSTINLALRADDQTKFDTLGPFCYLLKFVGLLTLYPDYMYEQIVYRSMNLNLDQIEQYKKAAIDGDLKQWLCFSSTTKSRRVAKFYGGNSLFIIELPINEYSFGIDISKFSIIPEEEEVLLPTQICFRVKKVDYDESKKMHIIHLNMNMYS